MDKKTLKTVAISAAVGVGVGAAVVVAYYTSNKVHIFKSAQWTPQGDMMLSFYHKSSRILLPKP